MDLGMTVFYDILFISMIIVSLVGNVTTMLIIISRVKVNNCITHVYCTVYLFDCRRSKNEEYDKHLCVQFELL